MRDLSNPATSNTYSVFVNPGKITKYLVSTTMLLLVGNIFNIIVQHNKPAENHRTKLLNQFLSFNGENNIPAFFSTFLLLFASIILFFVYTQTQLKFREKKSKQWLLLGWVFAFLAMDENIRIHETVSYYAKKMITNDLGGFLHYAWVAPYALLFLAVSGYLLKFVLTLPTVTRNLFFVSAAVFVGGALGLEVLEGYVEKNGLNPLYNHVLYTIEELMEMIGVTIFIYALLDYLNSKTAPSMLYSSKKAVASL